jgi:hypothetical protein
LSLLLHVPDLSDDNILDYALIECELAFAFLPDVEKIIVFMRCSARFPRRGDNIVTTQSIDAVDKELFQNRCCFQSFSLGGIPDWLVNSATSQAFFLLLRASWFMEPMAVSFIKAKKARLGLHAFLIFLSHLSQGFSLGSIDSSRPDTWTHRADAT